MTYSGTVAVLYLQSLVYTFSEAQSLQEEGHREDCLQRIILGEISISIVAIYETQPHAAQSHINNFILKQATVSGMSKIPGAFDIVLALTLPPPLPPPWKCLHQGVIKGTRQVTQRNSKVNKERKTE